MKPTEKSPPYSFLVRWSPEDREFVASFLELPELTGIAPTIRDAINEAQVALSIWIKAAKNGNFEIPEASMEKPCMILDGRFAGNDPLFLDIPEDFVNKRNDATGTRSASVSGPFKLNESGTQV